MMFDEFFETLLELWSKIELETPGSAEIFGLAGITVSSALFFLYLKIEINKNNKAEDELRKQKEEVVQTAKNASAASASTFKSQDERKLLLEIHHAASMSNEEDYAQRCIGLLMTCPKAVNIPREPYGFTPFLSACWAGSLPLVRYMLENGADMQRRTQDGDTPIYLAVRALLELQDRPRLALMQVLVDAGASVNAVNHMGYTPLHLAASRGSKRLVKWLLDQGASPCLRNSHGYRPIDLAKIECHERVVSLLTVVSGRQQQDAAGPDTDSSPSLTSSSSASSTASSFRSVYRNSTPKRTRSLKKEP